MHKPLYASGFLYSLKTYQILLLSSDDKDNPNPTWSILGGEIRDGEEANEAFARIVYERLKLKLAVKNIHPVYSYFHESLDKTNYVFYAEVNSSKISTASKADNLSWLPFHQTTKLKFSDHTKQDLIVGERVINARWRDNQEVVVTA